MSSTADTLTAAPVIIENCLLLDGSMVHIKQLCFAPAEKKHIKKMAAFMLEPELCSPIEDMHFAFSEVKRDSVCLAYCDKFWLQSQLNQITDLSSIEAAYVDYSLLILDYGPCLSYLGGKVLFRFSQYQGFSLEPDLAKLALLELQKSSDDFNKVQICGENQQQLDLLLSLLPDSIKTAAEIRPLASVLQWQQSPNLLQGQFNSQYSWYERIRHWRLPMTLVMVTTLLFFGLKLLQLQQLRIDNRAIIESISAISQQAIGRKISGNSQQQLNLLRSSLRQQQGSDGKIQLTPLLAKLLTTVKGYAKIQGLSYNSGSAAVQIHLSLDNFQQLEALQKSLQLQSFSVKLLSSRQDGKNQIASIEAKPL